MEPNDGTKWQTEHNGATPLTWRRTQRYSAALALSRKITSSSHLPNTTQNFVVRLQKFASHTYMFSLRKQETYLHTSFTKAFCASHTLFLPAPTNTFVLVHHLLKERHGRKCFFLPLSNTMFSILCLWNHLANNPRKLPPPYCYAYAFEPIYLIICCTCATCFRPQTVNKF